MTFSCPECGGACVGATGRAQQAAMALGGVAGVIQGVSKALGGEEVEGSNILGVSAALIAGVVVGGLLGGAAGCAAGSAIGAAIDHSLPNNLACQSCGHVFSVEQGRLSSG
jgi:hypothetical protein